MGEGCILAVNALLLSLASPGSTLQWCGFFFLPLLMHLQRLHQRQYIVTQADPGLVDYPTFKRLHDKMRRGEGGEIPHLPCKCEVEKWTVGLPPSPCKQALNLQLERVSIECRKSKTKVITLANQKGWRQCSKPIKTRNNYT